MTTLVNMNIKTLSEVVQFVHRIKSLALKTEGGQTNVGHLCFIFNYCFIIINWIMQICLNDARW